MRVDRRALGDEHVDVSDRDQQPYRVPTRGASPASPDLFREFDLIEIARFLVVDRRPEQAAKILRSLGICGGASAATSRSTSAPKAKSNPRSSATRLAAAARSKFTPIKL